MNLPGWSISLLRDLPPAGQIIHRYPEAGGAYDDLLIRVRRDSGETWIAACARGDGLADGIFLFSSDSSRFVVLHKGAGYYLSCEDPKVWEELPISPGIRHAIYDASAELLVVFDWIRGAAFGPTGIVWKSPRLFVDDLSVEHCSGDRIVLRGNEIPEESKIELSMRDGSILSGHPSRYN
jgi:hypothetical protein